MCPRRRRLFISTHHGPHIATRARSAGQPHARVSQTPHRYDPRIAFELNAQHLPDGVSPRPPPPPAPTTYAGHASPHAPPTPAPPPAPRPPLPRSRSLLLLRLPCPQDLCNPSRVQTCLIRALSALARLPPHLPLSHLAPSSNPVSLHACHSHNSFSTPSRPRSPRSISLKNTNLPSLSPPPDLLLSPLLQVFGKDWKKAAGVLGSRSVIQIRTHAQKHFKKIAKSMGPGTVPESTSCRSIVRKARMCRRCRGHGTLVPLQVPSQYPPPPRPPRPWLSAGE
jgi:hypothetical protein